MSSNPTHRHAPERAVSDLRSPARCLIARYFRHGKRTSLWRAGLFCLVILVGAGWTVKVEIRNGSKFNGYAPSGTGWQGITLVTEDGTIVPAASDAPELRDTGLAQGAGNTQNLFFPTESADKPARIILRFDPK